MSDDVAKDLTMTSNVYQAISTKLGTEEHLNPSPPAPA